MQVKATVNIGDIDWNAFRAFGDLSDLPPCEGDVCSVPEVVGAKLVARGWAVEALPPDPVQDEPAPKKETVKAKHVAASLTKTEKEN